MCFPHFVRSTPRCFSWPLFLLLLCALALVANAPTLAQSEPERVTTFAQFTDAHIFDDGYKQPTPAALRQAADDRDALAWAINTVNGLVASGVKIDFLVYTGDIGLQNVDFPENDSCKVETATVDPGLPMVSLRWAVNELANELNRLAVRKVYFVAGNNDPVKEEVLDSRRYYCFMDELRKENLKLRSALQITNLDADTVAEINGIRLAGLNSASFKKAVNYKEECSKKPTEDNASILREACPLSQMNLLQEVNSGGPLVLFTHIPDLNDPRFKTPSWDVEPEVRKVWERVACSPSTLAVFGGHFHDSNRMLYASASASQTLATSECVATKTWVAPPLAAKYQETANPQARGFLLATITKDGTKKVQPIWYEPAALASQLQAPDRPPRVLLMAADISLTYLVLAAFLSAERAERLQDVTAIGVAVLFGAVVIGEFWLLKNEIGITDRSILAAFLIIPFLFYGIVSGRLHQLRRILETNLLRKNE